MSEFVWFYGASGAGKASIIEKIASGDFLIPGLSGDIVVCRESLDWKRERRITELEKELGKYAVLDATILIKGQSVDLTELHLPTKMHGKFPSLKQRVVFVYTDLLELPNRVADRDDGYWPRPGHDFGSELSLQINEVSRLSNELGLDPVIIDNSADVPKISNAKLSDLTA